MVPTRRVISKQTVDPMSCCSRLNQGGADLVSFSFTLLGPRQAFYHRHRLHEEGPEGQVGLQQARRHIAGYEAARPAEASETCRLAELR